ncbi:MAG: hypothetical protein NVS3B28_13740 [Candidatus Velthaea sp.]
MKQLTALSISIAILAGVATFFYLSVGGILIWAAFLSWACFYHSGADNAALRNTIVGNTFGCFMAWVAAVALLAIPLGASIGLPAWAAIVVTATVFIVCIAANVKAFAVIPASFYGYAATFAFLLQTPGKLTLPNLFSVSLSNGPIVVALSLAIGALFGIASAKVGAMLMAKAPPRAQTAV